QFAANYITHTSDVIVWGTTESWVCPRATLYYAQGDCEDGAFLIASLLLNIGVSSAKVKVAIGYYDDTGHAWAMYQRASDDIWVNLDWTKGSTYWNAISSVDELPIAFSEA
ncbi:MAG: transglutaminase-like cysteine peptidase, partial [Bacteroidales bacterium]|nr:transglutaminase-like cysteine peptidase [Bacteroidales bacterium]